jgi:hypothetical protein
VRDIAEIEQELAQRAKQTEKERLAAVEKHTRELGELQAARLAEIAVENALIRTNEEKWRKERQAAAEAEEQRKREETASRIRIEYEQNAMAENLRLQKEGAERLIRELENTEFLEEQYRKSLEPTKLPDLRAGSHKFEINIEHPEAPVSAVEPGGAVGGTSGETPSNPEMSDHLKHILRQAERTY